jgi:hypothetical protein
MSLFIDLFQPFERDMGINLCRGKAFVAEKFLDRHYVSSLIEHVGRECVPENMRRGFMDSSKLGQLILNYPLDLPF